MGIWNI